MNLLEGANKRCCCLGYSCGVGVDSLSAEIDRSFMAGATGGNEGPLSAGDKWEGGEGGNLGKLYVL